MPPVQVYRCDVHGEFDVPFRFVDPIPLDLDCKCGLKSIHIIKAPAGISFSRTWNEKANEYQRNPYTQAKAQLTNIANETRDSGGQPDKITEAGIQETAKHISKQKKLDPKTPQIKDLEKTYERLVE